MCSDTTFDAFIFYEEIAESPANMHEQLTSQPVQLVEHKM